MVMLAPVVEDDRDQERGTAIGGFEEKVNDNG
jgi:hypothetical protein